MSGDNSAPDKLPQIDRKVCDAQIHLPGEGYSGKNKVPTVSAFLARQQAMTEDHSAEGDKLRASRNRLKPSRRSATAKAGVRRTLVTVRRRTQRRRESRRDRWRRRR